MEENALEQQISIKTQENPKESPSNLSKRYLYISGIIILFIVLIGAGVYYSFQSPLIPKNTPSFSGNDYDTSNWKMYKNGAGGFTIKYPLDWGIDEKNPIMFFSPDSQGVYDAKLSKGAKITIQVYDKNTIDWFYGSAQKSALKDYTSFDLGAFADIRSNVSYRDCAELELVSPLTINNYTAQKYVVKNYSSSWHCRSDGEINVLIETEKSSASLEVINIVFDYEPKTDTKYLDTFDQILSTFTKVNLNVSLNTKEIGDSNTEVIYSDGTIVYGAKLDGSPPEQLFKLNGNINSLRYLPNKEDLLINANNDKKVNTTEDWILKKGELKPRQIILPYRQPQRPGETSPHVSQIQSMTRPEMIYVKELQNGSAELYSDTLNGSPAMEIGFFNESPLKFFEGFVEGCVVNSKDPACYTRFYPLYFIPSFDGQLLLTSHFKEGGGPGTPAVVISRDGSKVYDIDLSWYGSATAIWAGNSKLLIQKDGEWSSKLGAQLKQSKILTFNANGTVNSKDISALIGQSAFIPTYLSPVGNHLLLIDTSGEWAFNKLGVYAPPPTKVVDLNIDTLTKTTIFESEGGIDWLLWNKESSKILFHEGGVIKIYNVSSGTTYTVAAISNDKSNFYHFEIR